MKNRIQQLIIMAAFGFHLTASGQTTFFNNRGQTAAGGASPAQYGGQFDANASDFQTGASAVSITGAIFSFANSDDINHVMTPAIYLDVSGVPGTAVGTMSTFNIPAAANPGDFLFATYSATSAGISLNANTKYWMVVKVDQATDLPFPVVWNFTSSQGTDAGSTFSTVSGTTVKFSTDSGNTTWGNAFGNSTGNAMFSMSGTTVAVPEPASVILLFGGLGATLLRRRK